MATKAPPELTVKNAPSELWNAWLTQESLKVDIQTKTKAFEESIKDLTDARRESNKQAATLEAQVYTLLRTEFYDNPTWAVTPDDCFTIKFETEVTTEDPREFYEWMVANAPGVMVNLLVANHVTKVDKDGKPSYNPIWKNFVSHIVNTTGRAVPKDEKGEPAESILPEADPDAMFGDAPFEVQIRPNPNIMRHTIRNLHGGE